MKAKKRKGRKAIQLLRLFQRRILIGLIILLQLVFYLFLLFLGSNKFNWLYYTLVVISIISAIYVINTDKKFSYKLSWVALLLAMPIVGGMLYILFHTQGVTIRYIKHMKKTQNELSPLLDAPQTPENIPAKYNSLMTYIQNVASCPPYYNEGAEYFPIGEEFYERLLSELKKARKYIFMEYFIIAEGEMWNKILAVLEQKAAEGVDVRVIYDDVGSFLTLPAKFPEMMKKKGIKCYCFNKFRPFITTIQNNRDHKKITVIDGNVAFTGGINIADEYINLIDRFGHWKDSAVMIKGNAAKSFAVIFLQMWCVCTRSNENLEKFFSEDEENIPIQNDGFVQPYTDSPLDKENVGEQIYINIIRRATKYLYITTPYLIIDDSMIEALKFAAKSGVDVRIITPRRYDKLITHLVTISYYKELIAAGVKIYEYTDGFIHQKVFISDNDIATVGTVNLDFRSLYLHFEDGVVIYEGKVLNKIYDDIAKTIEKSTPITEKDCKKNIFLRLLQSLLRLFAPLI